MLVKLGGIKPKKVSKMAKKSMIGLFLIGPLALVLGCSEDSGVPSPVYPEQEPEEPAVSAAPEESVISVTIINLYRYPATDDSDWLYYDAKTHGSYEQIKIEGKFYNTDGFIIESNWLWCMNRRFFLCAAVE